MAKSSYAVAMLLAGWTAGADADPPSAAPVTADAAMKRYEQWFDGSSGAHCPQPGQGSDEDIVVCGRLHRQPERSPLPVSRDPGEIVRHINELGNAVEAMRGPRCIRACQQPVGVTVTIGARPPQDELAHPNPIAIILAAPKVIRHILHPEDD